MYIYILILIFLFLLAAPIFYLYIRDKYDVNQEEYLKKYKKYANDDLYLTDVHIGETIILEDLNDKKIILGNLKEKGKIKLVSKSEDLVRFFFKGKYTIEETGNMCTSEIQCQTGSSDIKPEIIRGGSAIKDVSVTISNFEIMINNFEEFPVISIKAFNLDNVIIN